MKEEILIVILAQLFKLITPDMLRRGVDSMLDVIEDSVEESDNKLDDNLLPLVALIRNTFDIEDNDDAK